MIDLVTRYLSAQPPESINLEREVVALGAGVLPTLLSLIRGASSSDATRLCNLILAMKDPRIVALLLSDLRVDDSVRLKMTVGGVLARMGGPGVFEHFAAAFERGRWISAIPHLARLGDSRAIPLLHRKLTELVGQDDDERSVWRALDAEIGLHDDSRDRNVVADDQAVVARLVESLARLGDFRRTMLVSALYRYPHASAKLRQATGRAAEAAIDAGTFALACHAVSDPDEEVRYAFVEALYFLGVRGVATVLAERLGAEPDDSEVTGCIARRLRDLVGTDEPGRARAIDATFVEGVCYRSGVPIDYAELARLAATDDDFAKHELYLRTGGIVGWIDFPMKRLPPERRLAEAEAWIASEAPKFERGAHYRAGVRRLV